jgi:hypothetical protein
MKILRKADMLKKDQVRHCGECVIAYRAVGARQGRTRHFGRIRVAVGG